MPGWSEITRRITGPRANTLVAFLVSSPFWIFGLLFNEPATYRSLANAGVMFAIALVAQLAMGLTLGIGYLVVRKHHRKGTVPLWAFVTLWALSAISRTFVIVHGLSFSELENPIPLATRLIVSSAMAVVGFGIAAYGLDYLDQFKEARAEMLTKLLQEEEQLSAHRETIESMKTALVTDVSQHIQDSQAQTREALDRLEQALANPAIAQPALEELRALSDRTWQKISKDLWARPPAKAPKVRLLEILGLWARSNPFNLTSLTIVAVSMYVLVYSRVLGGLTGLMMAVTWLGLTVLFAVVANLLLRNARALSVPLLIVFIGILTVSAAPTVAMFEAIGLDTPSPIRVVIVNGLSTLLVVGSSLPAAITRASDHVLDNLRKHLDIAAIEKLHIESELRVLSQKIANRLHGDVRGNFLAAVLSLQGHLDKGDLAQARRDISRMRQLITDNVEIESLNDQKAGDLEVFLKNWSALIDISMEPPLSAIPEVFWPAIHTIVVDAVTNAVRHGDTDWVRITTTVEPSAVLVNIYNTGNPNTVGPNGLGTANLNLLAPDQWSRISEGERITRLLVRLDQNHVENRVSFS